MWATGKGLTKAGVEDDCFTIYSVASVESVEFSFVFFLANKG